MATTHPVSFRFSPQVKALLEAASEQAHRSQANLLEFLLLEHCRTNNIKPNRSERPPSRSK